MHPRWDARGPAEGEEQCRFRVALSETQSDGLRRLSQVAVPREAKLDVLSDIAEQSGELLCRIISAANNPTCGVSNQVIFEICQTHRFRHFYFSQKGEDSCGLSCAY